MISNFKIKNFKSIADLELDLGRVNIFIGENGCGKTNILEGVAFGAVIDERRTYYQTGDPISDRDHLKRNYKFIKNAGIRENHPEAYFSSFDSKNKMIFEINDILTKTISLDENEVWDVEMEFINEKAEFDSKFRRSLLNFLIFSPEISSLQKFVYDKSSPIDDIEPRGEGFYKHLVFLCKRRPEIFNQLNEKLKLIDWFKGFDFPEDLNKSYTEKTINIKDKYLEHLDYFDQRSSNEGFLFLLFYLTLFLSENTPPFFAIDNIDNALNPKLCAKLIQELIKIAKDENLGKQVLLTTHNPAVLDGLDLADEEQRLFAVYRNVDVETTARRVKAPKKIEGTEPVRLSEAFIRGYLGGLPNNF